MKQSFKMIPVILSLATSARASSMNDIKNLSMIGSIVTDTFSTCGASHYRPGDQSMELEKPRVEGNNLVIDYRIGGDDIIKRIILKNFSGVTISGSTLSIAHADEVCSEFGSGAYPYACRPAQCSDSSKAAFSVTAK